MVNPPLGMTLVEHRHQQRRFSVIAMAMGAGMKIAKVVPQTQTMAIGA
jgi:hypothetical protein